MTSSKVRGTSRGRFRHERQGPLVSVLARVLARCGRELPGDFAAPVTVTAEELGGDPGASQSANERCMQMLIYR